MGGHFQFVYIETTHENDAVKKLLMVISESFSYQHIA